MNSSDPVSGPVDFTRAIDKSNIQGKTALVTGAASGIGAAIAETLAKSGAYVTIADLNVEAGEKLAGALSSAGLKAQFVSTDVADWSSLLRTFKSAFTHSLNRNIDLVVAAAGLNGSSFFKSSPFTTSTSLDQDPEPPSTKVLDVNLTGAYYTALLAVHFFRLTNPSPDSASSTGVDKQLIFISSNTSYHPIPLYSIYGASKSGVRGLFLSLRSSRDLTGMRTNLIAPHLVRTPMTTAIQPALEALEAGMVEPEEIADLVVRLVCDKTINGRAIIAHPGGNAIDCGDGDEDHDLWMRYCQIHKAETKEVWDFMTEGLREDVKPVGQQ